MTQTIIQPTKAESKDDTTNTKDEETKAKSKAESNDTKDDEEKDDPEDEDKGECKDKKDAESKAAALEERVVALESIAKETLETLKAIQSAMLPGAGDETRGDHAGDRANLPEPTNAYAMAMSMPAGKERAEFVAKHADDILKAAFAARN